MTADEQYVVGFYEVDEPRGDNVAKAVVFLTYTLGQVRIPIEGACYSTKPECSPTGPWLALEALHGGIEIGILKVER